MRGFRKLIKFLICGLIGHRLERFRAPIKVPLSWHGWPEWSGVKCTRCYMVGGARNRPRMRGLRK